MASRHRWSSLVVLVAALAAGSLLLWSASSGTGGAPIPGAVRTDSARSAQGAGAPSVASPAHQAPVKQHLPPDHGTGPVPGAAATGLNPSSAAVEPPSTPEREEADRLVARMGKLLQDLEYTPGLPEPVQQTVVPPPEPWRRDLAREGPPPVILEVVPDRLQATGGDRVEIRGRNLRVVQVMIGGSPARLLSASGTLVAVEAPPGGSGPAMVAVTNDDGTWAVAQVPVAYVE